MTEAGKRPSNAGLDAPLFEPILGACAVARNSGQATQGRTARTEPRRSTATRPPALASGADRERTRRQQAGSQPKPTPAALQ